MTKRKKTGAKKSRRNTSVIRQTNCEDYLSEEFRTEVTNLRDRALPQVSIVSVLHGLPPLSERVLFIAKPWMDSCKGHTATNNLLHTAIAAWNVSQKDSPVRSEIALQVLLDSVEHDADAESAKILRQVFNQMIARRRRQFPDDLRSIVHFKLHVTPDGDDVSLQVASIWSPDTAKSALFEAKGYLYPTPGLWSLIAGFLRKLVTRTRTE